MNRMIGNTRRGDGVLCGEARLGARTGKDHRVSNVNKNSISLPSDLEEIPRDSGISLPLDARGEALRSCHRRRIVRGRVTDDPNRNPEFQLRSKQLRSTTRQASKDAVALLLFTVLTALSERRQLNFVIPLPNEVFLNSEGTPSRASNRVPLMVLQSDSESVPVWCPNATRSKKRSTGDGSWKLTLSSVPTALRSLLRAGILR